MDKLLLRPTEAAEVLGIGKSKVYELIAAGVLPSMRIGKCICVPTDELRKWVHQQMIANGLEVISESADCPESRPY